jgi:hypothetical protein
MQKSQDALRASSPFRSVTRGHMRRKARLGTRLGKVPILVALVVGLCHDVTNAAPALGLPVSPFPPSSSILLTPMDLAEWRHRRARLIVLATVIVSMLAISHANIHLFNIPYHSLAPLWPCLGDRVIAQSKPSSNSG